MNPRITTLSALASIALSAAACGVASPTAPAAPTPTPDPIVLSELHASYEPLAVYPGGSTQVHVGTFGHAADGTLRAVYDVPCAFATDGGELLPQPAGADTSWHVAVLVVAKNAGLGDRDLHVQATCAALTTTLRIHIAPDGSHTLPPGPAPTPAPTPNPTTGGGGQ